MQLSFFEMVKKGVSTTIEVVDDFARRELVRLENLINNLSDVARTGSYNDLTDKPDISQVGLTGEYNDLLNKPNLSAVATSGSYNDLTDKPVIPTDLNPTYFQLASSGSRVNIERQDCWRQGNRIHIAFSAIASMDMPNDYVWGIVPTEHRGRGVRTCGYVLIDNITGAYINSIMVEGVESGYVYQTWVSSVPANTRVTFIGDYFI